MTSATHSHRAEITCVRYESDGSRRCRHYEGAGQCALPELVECVEWRKLNPTALALARPPVVGGTLPLFQDDVSVQSRSQPVPARAAAAPAPFVAPPPEPLTSLTAEQLESFRALEVEVCMSSPMIGELWLVPRYRDTSRREISIDDAATLVAIVAAFPGAQVAALIPSPVESS